MSRHRHKLQQQRHKLESPNRRSEADEALDEEAQPATGRAKRLVRHEMRAEGKRPRVRLDKFRRGGRSRSRYDNGGPAGSSAASTRSADDPGGELATANRERKGALSRIQDELFGPKSAYARGGRSKKFDAGGATPPIASGSPSLQDIAFSPKPNPLVAMIQRNMPPVDTAGKIMAARVATPRAVQSVFPLPSRAPGAQGLAANRHGGRIKRQRGYDDGGGVADASPARPPALAFGNGPPPPPRISNDGTPIAAAPPRANDPSFLNRQTAAQKAAQVKQRVRQLEGKGR